jgi:hypothetical protein
MISSAESGFERSEMAYSVSHSVKGDSAFCLTGIAWSSECAHVVIPKNVKCHKNAPHRVNTKLRWQTVQRRE